MNHDSWLSGNISKEKREQMKKIGFIV